MRHTEAGSPSEQAEMLRGQGPGSGKDHNKKQKIKMQRKKDKKWFAGNALNICKGFIVQQTQSWHVFMQTLHILLLGPTQRFAQGEMYSERFVASVCAVRWLLVDVLCLDQVQRLFQGSWLMSVRGGPCAHSPRQLLRERKLVTRPESTLRVLGSAGVRVLEVCLPQQKTGKETPHT